MEPTLSSETSAFILRTPGKFPKEHRLHSEHGESLKTTTYIKTRLIGQNFLHVSNPTGDYVTAVGLTLSQRDSFFYKHILQSVNTKLYTRRVGLEVASKLVSHHQA